ncbi:MAG: DUF885 domain-containing protein [Chloroflexota bacterium]|nr:DUF885 domain-containing protein [Chloroflexota bacterium]
MAARDAFDDFAQEYYDSIYRLYPVEASWLGIHAYDDRLADLTTDGIEEQANTLRELRDRLAALDERDLPLDAYVDYQLVVADLRSRLWSITRVEDWQRNPVMYVQEPLFGLLALTARDYAPLGERAASLLGRLRAIPGTLGAGVTNVASTSPVLVETAIQTAQGGAAFIRDAVPRIAEEAARIGNPSDAATASEAPDESAPGLGLTPTTTPFSAVDVPADAAGAIDDDLSADLRAAGEHAARALEDHASALAETVADGDFAVGQAAYEERLRDWHMLDIAPPDLAAFGRRLFEDTLGQLHELAAENAPGRDWSGLVDELRDDHLTAEGLLGAYREELIKLRSFILEHELVTIPEGEQLDVVETPPFERATIPYAAYMPPAPFEPAQNGQFWVTPVDISASAEQRDAQLREHCRWSFPNVALHEGYPGHHLQLLWANRHPSFVRKHAQSDLFAEGWAHYCEQLMAEQGYLGDWRLRLFQLKDQLWRAARVVIDPSLHSGTMSFDEAVTLLVDGARLARAQAEGEVRRYCLSPTQPMTYAVGKQQILDMRSELGGLGIREFHDRLLASGTIPFTLVRQEMLAG